MTNRVYFEDLDEKTREKHIERSICLCAMEFYKLNLFREHKYYFACEFDSLILCENYFGVIRMANNGVNNAVATFGTTFLTNSQVDLLKRHAEKVYIDPISDDLGIRFAAHALDLLQKNDISASIID